MGHAGYTDTVILKADKSPSALGALSPDVSRIIECIRKQHAIWFRLAEDLNRTGQAILANYRWKPEGIITQHFFGILLLIRALTNYQGSIIMAERGLVVEARTLVRSCFETAFCIAVLLKDGDAFIKDMLDDDQASTKSTAKWLLKQPARLDFSGPNAARRLQQHVDKMDRELGKLSAHRLEDLAMRGGVGDAYLFYKVLSGDSAHASMSALNRYVTHQGSAITGINFGPITDEVPDTVNLACHAMLIVCVAISEMLGDKERNAETAAHAKVYAKLIRID